MSEPNVVQEVVATSLCCGCGVCAGVCPEGALNMRFSSRGELVPVLVGVCNQCGLCRKVCPALDAGEPLSPSELFGAAAREAPHIGRFVEAVVGYSLRHRQKGASGGMATWTIEELLRQEKIDAAVCVGRSGKNDRLFEPVIVRSSSDLVTCASSRYYPVEFSSALSHIIETEGRYAIVALPCVVTAIRKAQRALPVLRKRIPFVLALACGHGVNKHFADFLLAVVGLDEKTARNVDFRYAVRSRVASNFAFRAQRVSGERSRPVFFDGLYGRLWAGRFFVPRACDFCDDLFAPFGDATFMDAWLPEYDRDPRGTSVVVARHPELAELLREAIDAGTCSLRAIDPERIRRSQSAALAYKTVFLPVRVARARRDGLKIPRSIPCGPIPVGTHENLAKIKHAARDRLWRWTFDPGGQPRAFWVSVLTAFLRGQGLWRAGRHALEVIRQRIKRFKSDRAAKK
jgi:coenzyme F420-reducing hydrogenase beta subunit